MSVCFVFPEQYLNMDKQINLQVCYTCTWFHKSIWKIKFHWCNHNFFSSWCQSFKLNDIKFLSLDFVSANSITCVPLTCTHTLLHADESAKHLSKKERERLLISRSQTKIWHSVKCAEVIWGRHFWKRNDILVFRLIQD